MLERFLGNISIFDWNFFLVEEHPATGLRELSTQPWSFCWTLLDIPGIAFAFVLFWEGSAAGCSCGPSQSNFEGISSGQPHPAGFKECSVSLEDDRWNLWKGNWPDMLQQIMVNIFHSLIQPDCYLSFSSSERKVCRYECGSVSKTCEREWDSSCW